MPHKRILIRDAFTAFIDSKIPPGINVTSSLRRDISEEDLPLINVTSGNEEQEIFNQAPRIYRRTLDVNVEIYAKAKTAIQDVLDQLAEFLEYIIDREDLFTLHGEVKEIICLGTNTDINGKQAVQESGLETLRYQVVYDTDAGKYYDAQPDFDEIFANISDLVSTEILDIHQ